MPPDPPPLPCSSSPLLTPAQCTVPAPCMGQGQQAHKLALNWDTYGPTPSKWSDGWERFSVLPFTQVVRVAEGLDTTSPISVAFPLKRCHENEVWRSCGPSSLVPRVASQWHIRWSYLGGGLLGGFGSKSRAPCSSDRAVRFNCCYN